jgi:hypothetical protein
VSSKREGEGSIANPPQRVGDVYFRDRTVAPLEGPKPNFHDAFTQLHLDQLRAFVKRISGDRRDRRIDPNTDHIKWNSSRSSFPRVDEDFVTVSSRRQHLSFWRDTAEERLLAGLQLRVGKNRTTSTNWYPNRSRPTQPTSLRYKVNIYILNYYLRKP